MDDFLLDGNLDLSFKNGDIATGDATNQHQQLLLLFKQGELKQFPLVGVGIESFLLDDDILNLKHEIEAQFEADGMKVNDVQTNGSSIKIDASYES